MEFSEKEKEIVENIGKENLDYTLCALFNHRNEESVVLSEDTNTISVEGMEVYLQNPDSMLAKFSDSKDPEEKIKAGLALLELSISFISQLED